MHEEEMSFGKRVLAVLVGVMMFIAAFVVTLPAFAETEWPVWVIGFDFENSEVVLVDEDGFTWSAPFGEHSWTIGEEYLLVLSDDGDADIEE